MSSKTLKSSAVAVVLGGVSLVAFLLWMAVHRRVSREAAPRDDFEQEQRIVYDEEQHNLAGVEFSYSHRPPIDRPMLDGLDSMVEQLQVSLGKRFSSQYSVSVSANQDHAFDITVSKTLEPPTLTVYITGGCDRRFFRRYDESSGVISERIGFSADCTMQQPLQDVLRSGYDTGPCDLVASQVFSEIERLLPPGYHRHDYPHPMAKKEDITR